ncbi:aminotransferase class I/II-fold pyridoxal phosphate-dependent enzyme, partial [Clostridioides difficile]|uniref:aminotransferase class I/II-fold pyridoxal phosphate-dependent enzyme n=1 Tax=Clostridioides difficile TaxID=1496 RepID=UPI001EEDB8EF
KEELNILAEIAKEKDLWIIADEVYREFVYDGLEYTSCGNLEGDKIATDFMDKLSDGLGEKLSKLTEEDRKKYLEAINTLQYI